MEGGNAETYYKRRKVYAAGAVVTTGCCHDNLRPNVPFKGSVAMCLGSTPKAPAPTQISLTCDTSVAFDAHSVEDAPPFAPIEEVVTMANTPSTSQCLRLEPTGNILWGKPRCPDAKPAHLTDERHAQMEDEKQIPLSSDTTPQAQKKEQLETWQLETWQLNPRPPLTPPPPPPAHKRVAYKPEDPETVQWSTWTSSATDVDQCGFNEERLHDEDMYHIGQSAMEDIQLPKVPKPPAGPPPEALLRKRAEVVQAKAMPSKLAFESRRSEPPHIFSIVYWGGGGNIVWDMERRSYVPHLCTHCDSIIDAWRGRLDNAQVTFRMCQAEGGGFKPYVRSFSMLSAKATVEIALPEFYRWCNFKGKKVMTERVVIGTILEAYQNKDTTKGSGVLVGNAADAWEGILRNMAERLRKEADESSNGRGALVALMLDAGGEELRVADMLHARGALHISRLLIILGGPKGIPDEVSQQMEHIIGDYTPYPMLRCRLPGGTMHSYYALSSLFTLHDQGVLLQALSSKQRPILRSWPLQRTYMKK